LQVAFGLHPLGFLNLLHTALARVQHQDIYYNRKMMEFRPFSADTQPSEATKSRRRYGLDLDSIRQKIADIERLEREISEAGLPQQNSLLDSDPARRVSDRIRSEIEARLGFFPPFFMPTLNHAEVLDNLWQQSLSGYYDNPLPGKFKESVFALLSRYCSSPYAIVTHSCELHALGMGGAEILQLLQSPIPPAEADLEPLLVAISAAPFPLEPWPDLASDLGRSLIFLCITAYLDTKASGRCLVELKRIMGTGGYASLISFLAYVKASHLWLEAYPEIAYEAHDQVKNNYLPMLQEEPKLAQYFRSYYLGGNHGRATTEKALRDSEERYRELVENANDLIYTHDLQGKITSLNRAAERITGYTREEALKMNLLDFVSPEDREKGRQLLEPYISWEMPSSYEIEIRAKDGRKVALWINRRTIYHEGKPVALQGIARDITEHRRTEGALQQAKEKLEAWVNELEQRTREMSLLNEMGDLLRACLTTEEAYNVIVRIAQQIFPVHVGALYVITSARNLVESAIVWGETSLAERVFSPDECWALRRGRIHWVENFQSGLVCKHIHHSTPEGYLCVPMMAQSEALGVLHLTQPANQKLTEAKQRLAITMAEHIAMALSNLRLHETLRSQSIRDPLTGLFNRRFMEESLSLEVRRAARNQRPLGVIILDLDHFKHFNDTFGHEAGDTLLKELGAVLQANIRGEDIACRYGGEEFTLILPEGNLEITRQRAEFLCSAIRNLNIQHRGRPLGPITASMGVAVFPDHGRTGKSLLEVADAALYKSKDQGRDRVTIAD
jgi:diguanylate cyclase (GGDEF)-like protein/PAS domain S-box-containing protein